MITKLAMTTARLVPASSWVNSEYTPPSAAGESRNTASAPETVRLANRRTVQQRLLRTELADHEPQSDQGASDQQADPRADGRLDGEALDAVDDRQQPADQEDGAEQVDPRGGSLFSGTSRGAPMATSAMIGTATRNVACQPKTSSSNPVSSGPRATPVKMPSLYCRPSIAARLARLDPSLRGEAREESVPRIREEENAKKPRTAVAGFDLTFSPSKSVSAIWGVADAGTQALIAQAHHAAMRDTIAMLEDRVAVTHVGAGGIAQMPIEGVIATTCDHYDSRAADPQLHTHVVVSNKVQHEPQNINLPSHTTNYPATPRTTLTKDGTSQARHHGSGSATWRSSAAQSGSRCWPTDSRPSASSRQNTVRSGGTKVAWCTLRSSGWAV
ncbi:MobF family relaxase [Citricoccus muralis]|uniref:MobF family relaxase n=1 Tax=Citricoccus muralis TaxID=169134 RepID=UPI003D6B3772